MKFVLFMISKRTWSASDRLMLVTYLLMQERTTEAYTQFNRIPEDNVSEEGRIQYDYVKCYFDFCISSKRSGSYYFKEARAISTKYIDYPVQQ